MVVIDNLRVGTVRYAPLWPYLRWVGAGALIGFWIFAPSGGTDAGNLHALNPADPYGVAWHELGSFVWSPAAAQVIAPFTLLPFEVFEKALLGVNLAALAWLLGPIFGALSLALLPVASELLTGQIHLLLAVAIVVGMTHSGAWAGVILTKVTPGVGTLYFLGRREWRRFGAALGTTAGIALVSYVLWPEAWAEWVAFLADSQGRSQAFLLTDYPLAPRVAAGAVLAVLAGWRGRPMALPFIALLTLPAVWFTALSLLAAVPRLARR
jgi:hypothetical protein